MNILEEYVDISKKLYPVYVILFSSNTTFGHVIKNVTNSDYTHAAISLDSTMNNLYSFSGISYSRAIAFDTAGFVKESLWEPKYVKTNYFTVLVTFVNKNAIDTIKNKIKYFQTHFYEFKYNILGLFQYYLNFKNYNNHDETKKKKWFCSEFVAALLDSADISGFHNTFMAPVDIMRAKTSDVTIIGSFTIPTFKENELISKTNNAKLEFIKNYNITESYNISNYRISLKEVNVNSIISQKDKDKFNEYDVHKYTSFLDWKYLYKSFCKIFPHSNPDVRFDVYEMILRKVIIPSKIPPENTSIQLVQELKNISNSIGDVIIVKANSTTGVITLAGMKKYNYPELLQESYNISELDEVIDESSNWHKIKLAASIKPHQTADETLKKHSYPGYLALINRLDNLDDCYYIRQDMNIGTYKTIRDRIEKCNKLGNCQTTKNYYKGIMDKYISKGITVKDCDATIKWFDTVCKPALSAKIKELKTK